MTIMTGKQSVLFSYFLTSSGILIFVLYLLYNAEETFETEIKFKDIPLLTKAFEDILNKSVKIRTSNADLSESTNQRAKTNNFNLTVAKHQCALVRKSYDLEFYFEMCSNLSNDSEYQRYILDQLPYVSTVDKTQANHDRLITQIESMYRLNKTLTSFRTQLKPKLIYMNRRDTWGVTDFSQCPITNCITTKDIKRANDADAVLYVNTGRFPRIPEVKRRNTDQIWIMFINESPSRSWNMKRYNNYFNWTLTYEYNSVITYPYFRFNYSTTVNDDLPHKLAPINYLEGKNKSVAWFVSNCRITKSGRNEYAKELAKYIDVDVFGRCGKLKCPSFDGEDCDEMLRKDYKFYLAFENHKCKEYITEKAIRSYQAGVIPVFLGARKEEYSRILPNNSFIHVEDFTSPKDLAEYLNKLSNNSTLYNEYFQWKSSASIMTSTHPWCRLCSMLNEQNLPRMWYRDFDAYWRRGKCIGSENWKDDRQKLGMTHTTT